LCTRLGACRPLLKDFFSQAEPKAACTVCVLAVTQIKDLLSRSEDEIIRNLLEQCEYLPENVRNFCRMAISQFGRELIKYVKESIGEPSALCTRLGVCKSDLKEAFKGVKQDQACMICVLVVSQIQRMINESEEEIIRTLLQQCALLPENLQQYCRLAVNMYAKDLIDYIIRVLNLEKSSIIC
jgi:hypothetical protein